MKKITVLVALALLAAAGTSYAVTCAQDNVPAATLLVPYFKVSGAGAVGGVIPAGGVDTLVAMTNVSQWGVVAHVTVWNKQSAPVVDFNVPLTGYDVAFFSMRRVLNGFLNVNGLTQKLDAGGVDPCKNHLRIGTMQDDFMRFTHPQWGVIPSDWNDAIAFYSTPAFSGSFQNRIWDSLDESADYMSLTARPANDSDNPACGVPNSLSNGTFSGDFTGYVTINVVNYCTNFFPDQAQFYTWDAIATSGWALNGGPNVLMGDVFFIDPANPGGNISGEAAVAIEYDERLEAPGFDWSASTLKTFYARYSVVSRSGAVIDPVPAAAIAPLGTIVPAAYQFSGDGREPLGTAYAFRYMADPGMQTWATIWRGDLWDEGDDTDALPARFNNLCLIARNGRFISLRTFDNDENEYTVTPPGGGPSGEDPGVIPNSNVWWETNRILISGNPDLHGSFKGGWTRFTFNPNSDPRYHQAWVGVQHSALGNFVSVGHAATLMNQDFTCAGAFDFGYIGNLDN